MVAYTIEEVRDALKGADWTALEFRVITSTATGRSERGCLCQCSCGTLKVVHVRSLIIGVSKGCLGCVKKRKSTQNVRRKYSTHNRIIYNAWVKMKNRCYNPGDISYKNYGGIGVIVCEEWKSNYQLFLDWALDNNWAKGLQLDKDINGDGLLYSPKTCAWVTKKKNANHRKFCIYSEVDGVKMSLTERCEKNGLSQHGYKIVLNRVSVLGWDIEEALSTPIKKIKHRRNARRGS